MEENKCSACAEKGHTCIPFFVHENAMMHKDMDNERMHETIKEISEENQKTIKEISEKYRKTIMTICITFITIIAVFVAAYTIRTNIWLSTITSMNQTITELAKGNTTPEVDHDVHQQPDH